QRQEEGAAGGQGRAEERRHADEALCRPDGAEAAMTLIAQITDMHVRPPGKKAYGVVDTEAMLRAAVASILAQPLRPDALIASGDVTDCGLVEEYELLRDCL